MVDSAMRFGWVVIHPTVQPRCDRKAFYAATYAHEFGRDFLLVAKKIDEVTWGPSIMPIAAGITAN